ncbi:MULTISPECIES: hypothetical protein [unclassified Vibrio]|uniref:hypothetical protein n=1 Tax=unclassified Vibrio TaxID=2614977 RepID=UPI0013610EF6|nr:MULTISPECIES: hypothetical protein [unclassified Vibrio]NAW57716.1 hypothetical protein [Vibrio sp. V36_P2S2PM302]NAX28312.1 hypothetical protein [Vibrio sp. V38_P2S17PM301]NAX29077.1 hypothetical protein [Vibrio sp. V37_P2S8PM304]
MLKVSNGFVLKSEQQCGVKRAKIERKASDDGFIIADSPSDDSRESVAMMGSDLNVTYASHK